MGAKTWMIVFAEENARKALESSPVLDRAATLKLANALFPSEKLEPIEDGDLSHTSPSDNELFIGCFQGVSVVAAKEFGIDYPSKLPQSFITAAGHGVLHLHAMHSVVDWFAYAQWNNGKIIRSLSLSPDNGIQEDIGQKLPFEESFWAGEHPVDDPEELADPDYKPYPLPFHPLELGEAALTEMFGYYLEGSGDTAFQPESIPLMRYKRASTRSRWAFWR